MVAPRTRHTWTWALWLGVLAAPTAWAQPAIENLPPAEANGERLFGFEFEFAGRGNRVVDFREMPFENYERLMRVIVEYYGGNPADIRRVDFTKPTTNLELYPSGERSLFRAEWTDARGRTWKVEPEYVASSGFDGYELVTPPVDNPTEVRELLDRINASGLVREGVRSGVHLNLDGRRLVGQNGDARALANFILMHERMEPMLRRMFNPVRGGGHANYFSRSLAADHPELLERLGEMPESERTRENLERLFSEYNGREMRLHEVDPMDPNSTTKSWKYRSLNLAKVLNLNPQHNGNLGVVEIRMFDLHALENSEAHRLQAEFYRRMITEAERMAERGETMRWQPRAEMPAGENWVAYNTPDSANEARAEARRMIESLGLDPADYERLLERNISTRVLPTETEARGMLERLPGGRVTHNGAAFTYGFELEGSGEGFARIARPLDAEVNARWDAMSDAQKMEYYREVVGSNRRAVSSHFDLDLERFPWLDPDWKVEYTGNWEVRSRVFESVEEAANRMREIKELTGRSGKGFHLHMRDNGVDWERMEMRSSEFADFIERSANWVWLERARRLGTMLSMKSWSNARPSTADLNEVARLESSDRSTIRVTVPSDREYIDLEIRGFTKYVDDIERLARIYTEALRTGNFGPWRHNANRMAMEGEGEAPRDIRFEDSLERHYRETEGREMTPEMRRIADGLQHDYIERSTGEARTYSTNVGAPLLPWEMEASLDESTRREMRFAREEYLRRIGRMVDRVADGRYGVDLEVASERALTEHLGMSEAEARAVVEHRRARGGAFANVNDVVAALATGEDVSRASRAFGFDLVGASEADLVNRLGISEEAARRIVDLRESRSARNALGMAGVSDRDVTRLLESSPGLDLNTSNATAEEIARRTGLDLETARRIAEYRTAHAVASVEDLRAAGLGEAEARSALELVRESINLDALSAERLAELGLSESEVRSLLDAREANTLRRYDDLRRAGFSDATIERLRADRSVTMDRLNTESLVRLRHDLGLTTEEAERLSRFREATSIRDASALRSILGAERANELTSRTAGVDLASASFERLVEAGVSEADARRIVNYRDAREVGMEGRWSRRFSAETASIELFDAEILSEAEAERLRRGIETVDLERVTAETLTERFGLEAETARRVVELRDATMIDRDALTRAGVSEAEADRILEESRALDLRNAEVAEVVERTGLSEAAARRLIEASRINFASTSAAEVAERLGVTEAEAERLLEFRTRAGNATGLDYNEINRQVRYRVKVWARETNLSEALFRSLLPLPENAEARRVVTSDTRAEGEGFSRVRRGVPGEFVPSRVSYAAVESIFEAVRESAIDRVETRLSEATTEAERATFNEGLRGLETSRIEIVETNNILAEANENRVRVSTGLLNEIDARAASMPPEARELFRARALGLIMGHETAHIGGFRSERMADVEGLRILEASELSNVNGVRVPVTAEEIRETVAAFDRPTGASRFDNLVNRVRNLARYGTTAGRTGVLEEAARGEYVDRLAEFRRPDGTLRWGEVTRSRALQEGVGLAHFGLALFLKEVATVAATGDRARIEEFFDGLMTTDFYKHYGLFVLGARAGELAYSRYLERYIRPRFVNGILKSNLILAAGIALPMIVEGNFEGRTFAISVASLGLSSAAVKAGVSGIRWVTSLRNVEAGSALARTATAASRLRRFGGWVYTAAELAVILYVAEEIDSRVNEWLDDRAARAALEEAGRAFFESINDPNATEDSIAEATAAYHDAWSEYRNWLYTPLEGDEAIFLDRLEGAARRAKLAADEREATLARVRSRPALLRNIESRYGSLDAYADHLLAEEEAELNDEVEMFADSYNMNRDNHLREVYEEGMRGEHALADVEHALWAASGGAAGTDPLGSRGDIFANMGRDRARGAFFDALGDPSGNRMESYDDEEAILSLARDVLAASGREELATGVLGALELTRATRDADRQLWEGDGSITREDARGMVDVLGGAAEAAEGGTPEGE